MLQKSVTGKRSPSGRAGDVSVQTQKSGITRTSSLRHSERQEATETSVRWWERSASEQRTQRQSLIFVSAKSSGNLDARSGLQSKSDHRAQASLLSLLVIGPWNAPEFGLLRACLPDFSPAFLVNLRISKAYLKQAKLGNLCFYKHPGDPCDQRNLENNEGDYLEPGGHTCK